MFPIKAPEGGSPSGNESIVSKAPTEHRLSPPHIERGGSLPGSSSRGSLTAASSLSDLLAYEQLHVDTESDPLMQKRLDDFETELS